MGVSFIDSHTIGAVVVVPSMRVTGSSVGEDTDPSDLPLQSAELTVHFSAGAFREVRVEARLGSMQSEDVAPRDSAPVARAGC
jgi:hypothetical protein